MCIEKYIEEENRIKDRLCDFITKELHITNIKRNCCNITPPYELSIYVPEYKLAIEYNGLITHSEKCIKDCKYHLNKLEECNNNGIKLIQVFEDEYNEHTEVVYEKIRHLLHKDDSKPKIFARKCEIAHVEQPLAKEFLNKNHVQGYGTGSLYYGAYYKHDLVGVMAFKQTAKGSDEWELTRFASDIHCHCVGLGGKLFNQFIKENNPKLVKSFADRRWTLDKEHNLYVNLGFKLDYALHPDYRYVLAKEGIREHKFNFRKKHIIRKFPNEGFNMNMTEREMMLKLGIPRIYDCGLFKYVWYKNENGEES